MGDQSAPPTPNAPPAPDLSSLYGDSGKLVAAPPTTPAAILATPSLVDKTGAAVKSGATKVASYINNMTSPATTKAATQAEQNHETQLAGEQEYSDWLYKNNPDEYRQANPSDYLIRKTHDFISDAATAPATRGMTAAQREKFEPQLRAVTEGGLGIYNVPSGGAGVGKTEGIQTGSVIPEEAGLESLEGKKVGQTAPDVEIRKTGPDWDRVHSAYIDGKKVGSVGYKVDASGRAQIYGSQVDPKLRGQGVGQKLYGSVIDEAPTKGAKKITSDSTNTTADANRVWQKIGEKGKAPVEEITHPNGKPGYQIDFQKTASKLPPQPKLPDEGQYAAIKTDDGGIYPDLEPEKQRTHVKLAQDLGIPADRIVSGGWLKDGEYEGSERSDAGRYGERARAQKAVTAKRMNDVDPLDQLHGNTGKKVADAPARNPNAPEVSEGANAFNAEHGRPDIDTSLKKVSEPFAKELADHFEELQHDPTNPDVQKTYKALKNDIDDQWNYATQKMGMKFEPWDKEGQPYANSREMVEDVKNNHHLYFYQGGDMPADHPMAETDAKTGLTYNDKLRAVHDLFGHAAEGHQFGPTGEENAYQVHRQMFSPEAVPALTGETRAQNSWVNYGPHLRGESGEMVGKGEPGYVAPKDRPFAEQKAVMLDPRFTESEPKSANVDTTAKSANAYHPDLQKVADRYGVSEDASGMKGGGGAGQASFITPDGKFIHLPAGVEHPDATRRAGVPASEDSRVSFLNDTGAVRTRFSVDRAGPTMHISVPKEGVKPEQVPAVRQAIAQAGRNGNVVMERADVSAENKDTATMSKEFPRAADTEDYLRQIQAHPEQRGTKSENEWHQVAGKAAATEEAGGVDPRTGKSDTKGVGVEVMPELRQSLDHAPTAEDFKKFYDQHRDIFDKHPELRVGWDNNSAVPGGHEINVGAVGDDAARVAKKLDQKSVFNIEKGEIVPTGGSGLRTDFPNYPLEDRMRDLKGENPSDIKNFEHLSKDVYDHLEPDERDYLKGNKTLQRNVMAQYHKIAPSVNETTNAMQAGAALGGWWKRYMDVFHTLAEGGKQTPQGIPLYHYTGRDFEHFDPFINGRSGDFGIHLGSLDQAHERMHNPEGDVSDTPNIRPVYANIKNPIRLQDFGNFGTDNLAEQLKDKGVLSAAEYKKITDPRTRMVEPENLRRALESKGYDGIVYLNRVEGVPKGVYLLHKTVANGSRYLNDEEVLQKHPEMKGNDSYVAMRPEQIQPKYSAELLANTVGPSHAEVLKQWHAALSGNKSVEDANNLAWHSYADWLDAGKPTDRKSINDIIKKNAAQPEGSEKKGNAAISDTLDKKGRVISPGLDTNKLYNLVNSPEMKGERPFGGDVFREDAKNPLMGPTVGARKIPSMGATVAGKGNLNRLVIDAHIRDFYGHKNSGGPAAQYIADSAHLRQAAEALGLKGGEGQEQLWGTVLGLKTLLKEGLTPEEAGKKLNADVINKIGKDYAEVIANDPEITRPGGVLDRLKERYGIGRGSAGISGANRQASGSDASEGGPNGSEKTTDTSQLAKTAERIRGQISESKIKKPATEGPDDTSFNFGANVAPTPPKKKSGKFNALDLIRGLDALKKPAPKSALDTFLNQAAAKNDLQVLPKGKGNPTGTNAHFLMADGRWLTGDPLDRVDAEGDELTGHPALADAAGGEKKLLETGPVVRVVGPREFDFIGAPQRAQVEEVARVSKGQTHLVWDMRDNSGRRLMSGEGSLGELQRALDKQYPAKK